MPARLAFSVFLLLLMGGRAGAQVSGRVVDALTGKPIKGASVSVEGKPGVIFTNESGYFEFRSLEGGWRLFIYTEGFRFLDTTSITGKKNQIYPLRRLETTLEGVTVQGGRDKAFGVGRLKAVEEFGIYEAKKSDVIRPGDLAANTSTNNARQIYNRIPGLNIWENEGAGLQLGIGGRGLSPNRTSNFNTRQNGYDISADALGYPESYYTPPTEAVDRIEMTRGAAALQYGTQFGGMLNFRMRRGAEAPLNVQVRQTIGSYGFSNSFVSVNGTAAGGRLNYFTFYQHKQADGWRQFSRFNYDMAFAGVEWKEGRWKLRADYTFMHYLARQPGGITDKNFDDIVHNRLDPRLALRKRNWFQVQWNLPAFSAEYTISNRTSVTLRAFGLVARRQALGKLDRINVADQGGSRDLIDGQFKNIGAEARLLHKIVFLNRVGMVLTGVRLYKGHAISKQGLASGGGNANFTYNRPDSLESGSFTFPSFNGAAFAEAVLPLSDRINMVPGVRLERIYTGSNGYYRRQVADRAGNLVQDSAIADNRSLGRNIGLLALGASYKTRRFESEVYANVSQNYRAINFNDIRISNPNIKIDPNIKDEKGFSADLGWRCQPDVTFVSWDVSLFYLQYNNRIGQVLRLDTVLSLDYRYRTNVSKAVTMGFEGYAEVNLNKLARTLQGRGEAIASPREWTVSVFGNLAVIDARYVHSKDPSVEGKKVELVPPITIRGGAAVRHGRFKASLTGNYVAEQYTDASNAKRSSSAVNGIIPAYSVVDFTASCGLPWGFTIEGSLNNLLNQYYFTRRADSYPGPGIILSDPRTFYLTLDWKIAAFQKLERPVRRYSGY